MSKLGPTILIKQTNKLNTASVIFLHGSGDTGKGVSDWIKFLVENVSLPHIKFLFPTAPIRPYTPLNGELSNVWFDRQDITPFVPEHEESLNSIKEEIKTLVKQEVESGIPLNKIMIGGFSMGGALALNMAYRFLPGFAGVFALSSFLNNDSGVYKNIKTINTPLYWCHGNRDNLVHISWGEETFKKLTALGVQGEFITLENTFHELKKNELLGLFKWIQQILPPPEVKE